MSHAHCEFSGASCISGILKNVKVEGPRLNSIRPREVTREGQVRRPGTGQGQPYLAVGEELQVSVARRLASQRYLDNVRGSLLETTAAGQLQSGDSLRCSDRATSASNRPVSPQPRYGRSRTGYELTRDDFTPARAGG